MRQKEYVNNPRVLVSTRQSVIDRINNMYPNIKTFSKRLVKAIEDLENFNK